MNFAPVGIKCPDHGCRRRSLACSASVPTGATGPEHDRRPDSARHRRPGGAQRPRLHGDGVPGGRQPARRRGVPGGALIGAAISVDGDWYRLVTAMFLHASLLHLAFNMLALYWLGTIVELSLGTWRFLLVYFVSGIAGSAGALALSDPFAVTVGASGAIYGIMGALLVLEYLATGSFAGQALGLIVLNLALTFAIPNISIGGHLGGLVGGILATFALAHYRHARPRSPRSGARRSDHARELRRRVRARRELRVAPLALRLVLEVREDWRARAGGRSRREPQLLEDARDVLDGADEHELLRDTGVGAPRHEREHRGLRGATVERAVGPTARRAARRPRGRAPCRPPPRA